MSNKFWQISDQINFYVALRYVIIMSDYFLVPTLCFDLCIVKCTSMHIQSYGVTRTSFVTRYTLYSIRSLCTYANNSDSMNS